MGREERSCIHRRAWMTASTFASEPAALALLPFTCGSCLPLITSGRHPCLRTSGSSGKCSCHIMVTCTFPVV